MATSNKCMWFALALTLTFAVEAATLQPSAATRVLDDAEQEASGSSPRPPAWRPRPLPPLPCIPGLPRLPWLPPCNNNSSPGGGGGAPVHPHLPPLPCIPGLPRLPWMPPCNNGSSSSGSGGGAPIDPQPAECRTSLSGLAPCAEFLANASSVSAPAAACCDGVRSLVKDAPICLCHAMSGGGDLGKLLPAHVLRLRVMALPRTCHVAVPFGTLRKCIRGPVPPMDAPSTPPAAA